MFIQILLSVGGLSLLVSGLQPPFDIVAILLSISVMLSGAAMAYAAVTGKSVLEIPAVDKWTTRLFGKD